MGTGVPLLNEYKQAFVFKRIPQTILGGLKIRLGYDAPAYVYVIQIILWLVPWLLGNIFTLVLELAYSDDKVEEFLLLYTCLYGACIIIFVVVIQTITTVVQMKEKENLHAGAIQKKKNILAEEDEVEFESCCGAETLGFVIPPKKFKLDIILHGLLSGLVCGVGFWYLLPHSLNQLFGYNYGATATIYIIGWITVSIAQYSLTSAAPPEPAIYRTMDVYELLPLTRPFYTFMCYSIHIVYWYHDYFKTANQAVHIVFILLPLLWFSGLLPPVEMVFLWILEQFVVFFYGGSPSASNLRLLIHLLLSTGVFFGCYYMPSTFIAVVFAAVTGYILSIDLGALANEIFSLCDRSNKNRVSSTLSLSSSSSSSGSARVVGFLWSWRWSTSLYHCLMVVVVGGTAAAVNYHSADMDSNIVKYIGYAIIGLFVVEKVIRDFQVVYVAFGMLRNPFYPKILEVSSQLKKTRQCQFVSSGILRRCLIDWVCPLVMTAYLSLSVSNDDVTSQRLTHGFTDAQAVFFVFGVVRGFRSVWQSTTHALLEMSVIHIIVTEMSTNSVVEDLQTPTLLLVAGITRDRLQQFINKVYFVASLTVSSWMDKKQRRSSMTPIIILNILFFPVLLTIIILASILSAPLLPLFTLPLFFIGYPRHNRFWPEPVGQSASTCGDSMYYKQLSTELAKGFRSAFATGSLGEPEAGNHYLVRFQDRLVWCLVLERGAGYCTLSIKGLELQETSCHTAEAARIDEQFEEAFEPKARGCCTFNSYPLHCLTPLDAITIKTYSDAKNVLTGVIDFPDSADVTLAFFTKTLVWVLLHHVNRIKKREEEKKRLKEKEIAEMERENSLRSRHDEKLKMKVRDSGSGGGGVNMRKDKVSSGFNPLSAAKELGHKIPKKTGQQTVDYSANGASGGDSFPLPPININRTNLVHTSRPSSRESNSNSSRKGSISSSLHSFTDSIWSDDFNPDKSKKKLSSFSGANKSQPAKVSTVVSIANPSLSSNRPQSPHAVLTTLPPVVDGGSSRTKHVTSFNKPSAKRDHDKGDMDDFLDSLELGLPAVDVNTSHGLPNVKFDETCSTVNYVGSKRSAGDFLSSGGGAFDPKPSRRLATLGGNHIYKPVMNLASSPDFTSQFSSKLSIPSKWRELPIESSQLTRYLGQFPTSWYKHTLSKLDWTLAGHPVDKVMAEVSSDHALTTCYTQLVMACYSAFDTPGRLTGASFLYKCYHGEVQWNAMMDWLSEDKELLALVLKAFRYSFKLMLDQTLLGDIADDEELEEYLTSYDDDWYIGKESDPEWGKAVLANRPNLFSLGHNLGHNTYTSRTLSIQDLPVYIGKLNAECVRGQWSNLNMELLYMTNDDEERYSIQALPAMLRNLTVQAADPPLGYPVYSSPPISVPTV